MLLSELEDLVNRMRLRAKDENPHVLFMDYDQRSPAVTSIGWIGDIARCVVDNAQYSVDAPLANGDYILPLTRFRDR